MVNTAKVNERPGEPVTEKPDVTKYAIAGGIATAVGVGIWYWWRTRKKEEIPPPPTPVEPPFPWEWAQEMQVKVKVGPAPAKEWTWYNELPISIKVGTAPPKEWVWYQYLPVSIKVGAVAPPAEWTWYQDLPVSIKVGGITYTLSVSVSPSGAGTVTISPYYSYYYSGTKVTLTAKPKSGYEFSHWEGDVVFSKLNPTPITMDSNKRITAVFKKVAVQVSFTFYLVQAAFPPEWRAEYIGWYIKYLPIEGGYEFFGRYTDWSKPITIVTDKPVGAIYVYGKTSPIFTFGNGCSYYYNWNYNRITTIYCPS